MRKLFLAIVALTVVLGFSGPSLAEKVRVGLPVPLTGFVAESAQEMVQGFKLYLEQNGGKLGGLEVDFIVEDTQTKPETALTKMRKVGESDKIGRADV